MEKAEERMDVDAHLLQDLNGFILLIGDSPHQREEQPQANSGEQTGFKVDAKVIANYLRLRLLSYLRQLQLQGTITPHREALIQWWVTLLNFLNNDLINKNNSEEGVTFQDPLLGIDSISVALECISRLMSSLMVLPLHDCKDAEIYSHHILLTIHYVTTRLILNSKQQRELNKQPLQRPLPSQSHQSPGRSTSHLLNSYTSLLRSFLGKLNAYAFFFLPDDFHYDTQLLLALKPNLTYKYADSLFIWKRRSFSSAERHEDRIKPQSLENRDTKFFKIVISYMKNDFIFMAFYWHYWYIALRFLAHLNGGSDLKLNLSMIPGASVLMAHATSGFLRVDFIRLTNFLQSHNGNGPGFSPNRMNASNPPSPAKSPGTLPPVHVNINANANASAGAGIDQGAIITAEVLNDFLFSNFRILRVWECLRDLSGALAKDPNLPVLLSLHDSSQLRYISGVPAHDFGIANIIYNKIFQFIIFQFRSLSSIEFLHWDIWFAGVCSMLQTLNNNSQAVALLFLFNVWPHIPTSLQSLLSQQLINDYWDFLGIDNDFQLVKVLFLKLLVFRIVPDSELTTREQLKVRFQNFYAEMLLLRLKVKEEPLRDREDELYFYGSKRFFLVPNKSIKEQDLICRAEKHSHPKYGVRYKNFPTVSSVANLRPLLILKNGRYPYDVFDEMVPRVSLLIDRKRKETQTSSRSNSSSSASHLDTTQIQQRPSSATKISSFSNTINSWISKLSKTSDQSKSNNPDVTIRNQSQPSTGVFMKGEKNSYLNSEESVPLSESSEMLSMYSNVSSIATRCTGSSETNQNSTCEPHSNFDSDISGATKETSGSFREDRRKKKLLAPAELKYSSSVTATGEISTLFKVMVTQAEPIGRKIERANSGWGIVTAKTYNKPLPVPCTPSSESSAVSSVIEELNNDSFGIDYLNESSFELFPPPQDGPSKASEVGTMSAYSDDATIPKPNCRLFGIEDSEDSNVSTGDSDLLNRFQKLTVGESEDEEDEKSILKGVEGFDEDIIASRRRALRYNRRNLLKTRLNKLSKIIRMFNKTAEEYYNYLNFLNHGSIFIDFEIRPPTHNNSINVSGD